MKRIYFLLLALLSLAPLAQAQYAKAVYGGADEQSPDAVYRLISRSYTLNSDGSQDIRIRKELTILRNRALVAYADKGETFIQYNPAIDELTINESYTLLPDGSKVTTPRNAFVSQLPSGCENCGRYNGIREMAVVHTGMEYGATIVLDYTIHRQSPVIEDFIIIAQDCPVENYEVSFNVPNLRYHAEGERATTESSTNEIAFFFGNVAQTLNDPYLPEPTAIYPYIVFSNQEHAALHANPDSTYIPDAEDLIATCHNADPLLMADALRNYVVDNVTTNDIHPALLNYQSADALTTWHSNCGTPVDKAVLLAQLLNQAGMQAFVLVGSDKPAWRSGNDIEISSPQSTLVLLYQGNCYYALSPIRKNPIRLYGVAQESGFSKKPVVFESKDIPYDKCVSSYAYIEGSTYSQVLFPQWFFNHNSAANMLDPKLLTSSRKAPLHVEPTNEQYTVEIQLPEGVKMVGKKVRHKVRIKGVASMDVQIKQVGNTLRFSRHLAIETDTISDPKTYEQFRQMIILWNQTKQVLVKE